MNYPDVPDFDKLSKEIVEYGRLKHEYGAAAVGDLLREAYEQLALMLDRIKRLPEDGELKKREPDGLGEIRALRSKGPRRLWRLMDESVYHNRLQGALIGRLAGCTLGAPVEFWPVEAMEKWAAYTGDSFPPEHYWTSVKKPNDLRYYKSAFIEYTRGGMNGVPVDDDIVYTLLGLLIAEDFGLNFTVEDVGSAWLKYLPYACTAEEAALANLKAGVPAAGAADVNNPYCQWIGADIRSDPWGYLAPGRPERAAAMAWTDACISHRRNGVYGEMLFSAAIAAAFAVADPLEAIQIGLTEIPSTCSLHRDVQWALREGPGIGNYRDARQAVEEHFKGMSGVHTNNNACLTIFGLMIGGGDFTRTIGETVAMGLDNDCTAATAGSLLGAVLGIDGIPAHWYERFNNRVLSYLTGQDSFSISDLLSRFAAQARKVVY